MSRPSRLYEKNINENISRWVLSDFTSEDSVTWLDDTIKKTIKDVSLLIEGKTSKKIVT